MTDDAEVRAIGVHAHREATNPDIAVIAALAGDIAEHVRATHVETAAALVGEFCAHVALVEVPAAVWARGHAVERVVMLAAIEARQKHFTLIDRGIKDTVAIHVGKDDEVWRLRDHDLTVDGGHAQRRGQVHILYEDRRLVGLTRTGGIFEDDDTVAFLATTTLTAVVHALGDKHPTLLVEVDICRVKEHRRSRPDRDFKAFGYGEEFWGDEHWTIFHRDGLRFVGLLGKHHEANRSGAALTAALQTTVVEGDLRTEADHARWQVIGDDGSRMRADTIGVDLTGDGKRTLGIILAHEHGTVAGGGGFPLQIDEVLRRAVGHEQRGLDPGGPVAVAVTEVGDQQVKFLGTLEVSGQFGQANLILSSDVLSLSYWLPCGRRGGRRGGFGGGRGGGCRSTRGGTAELGFAFDLNGGGRNLGKLARLRKLEARCVLALIIQVGVELIFGNWSGLHPRGRHFDLRGPDNGIKRQGPEAIDGPVAMVMTPGETDPAAAIGAFDTPHQRLHLTEAIDAVLVPKIDILLHVLPRRHGRDEVEHLAAVSWETHIVIELVVGLHEAVHAARYRMIRQSLEVSDPMRIDGPARLKRAANPGTVVLFAILGIGVDGIVHEHDTRTLLGQLIDLGPTFAHDARAVRVDDEALDAVQDRFILRPAADDHGLEA